MVEQKELPGLESLRAPAGLFRSADKGPHGLTAIESYGLGFSGLGAIKNLSNLLLGPQEESQKSIGLEGFTSLLIIGLQGIRADRDLADEMKLRLGLRVLAEVDFQALPIMGRGRQLFAETWFTIAAGLKIKTDERTSELQDQTKENLNLLTDGLCLGSSEKRLSPVNQLRHLETGMAGLKEFDDDSKKWILLAWAKELTERGMSEMQFNAVCCFFSERYDYPTAYEA